MNIHEYQAKELLKQYGVPVPAGEVVYTDRAAARVAEELGGVRWVVKAQIHAGGRGKGGGVKLARSIDEVKKLAGEILGMQLVTHQTGPAGQKVRRLLIEEGANIAKELYLAMVVDRVTQKVTMMASELLQNGLRRIGQVLNEVVTWLKEHEYESVTQMVGAMSQKHCAEPAAFERANYMKMLDSYRPLN